MKCPHCGHDKSRVTDTENKVDAVLRYRMCLGCAKKFTSLETISVYWGREVGWLPATANTETSTPPEPEPPPVKRKAPKVGRYMASLDDDLLVNVCAEAQPLLVQWWNESRWSKHKSKATWTQSAWKMSVERISDMAKAQQIELAKAGVENGWQTLKSTYLDDPQPAAAPTATGRPMPKDPSMLAALESWPS